MRGGIASAAVSLGILLPLGLLPYAVLGAQGAALGTHASFVASVVGGAIMALVGGAAVPGSGPRTSTALILAGFVAGLAADPALRSAEGLPWLVALASACVAVSGLLQMLFAAARLGSIATYVPLPVVAGFMDGVAILIIVSQARLLLSSASGVSFSAIGVALATAAIAWFVARRWSRTPWALLGIAAGSVVYWIVSPLVEGPRGDLLGAPASGYLLPIANLANVPSIAQHLPQLLTSAAVIAVIGSLESLLAAAGLDARFMSRHRPNRMLLGQGELRLGTGGGQRFRLQGGFLQVVDDQVRVVTEHATKL